ncbi:TetR family transcriptional regulator [Alicyclobacillus acidoterrestris]|uniref:TetR/AcrR family transcriptional regulator n=1 Tax=Alicyclobacillus suci TaxID=2816080 RepID=UPI001195C0F7|nr:TetR/AcrR family transcriptional regulator [Alicyclobacillus suci]GEO24438.1 TetR family transcriptional regulator [Alicyclobacillus acidoterrestris]
MADEQRTTYHQPKTSRGQRRVNIILDAAEQLIAEIGYDAMTTNAIALRAETSIGSLYQFFPNKESVVQALADRYRSSLTSLLDDALELASTNVSFSEQLECIIDKVVQFKIQHVAFEFIFDWTSCFPAESLADEVMSRLLSILSLWAPEMSMQQKQLYAEVCIRIMSALLPATHVNSQIRPEMVTELKRVLANYLLPLFGSN